MIILRRALGLAGLLLIVGLRAAAAQALPDAPQLAAPGSYAVGVTRLDLTHKAQPDLIAPRAAGAPVPRQDRLLPLTIWYPATPATPAGSALPARYTARVPGPVADGYRAGAAFAEAKPLRGERFPLVVFSHGYRNWATGFSDLAEGLASHGYVVAAIDHRDAEPSATLPLAASFAMTVVSRSADQRFVIAELARLSHTGKLAEVYDPTRIALIGYSMGGFGALATAGAGFDPQSRLYKLVPDALLAPYAQGAPLEAAAPAGVKAVVAFAPWGGSEPLRAWTPEALAQVATPTLIVVGDHDDVSGYAGGVQWLYDHLTHADRRLLLFQNARHNIPGDGVAALPAPDFATVERFEEPVWRRDRLLAIDRHFVLAFLDATLKGDATHAALLDPPTPKAEDGVWPLADGQSVGGAFAAAADPASNGYWPGFQRRWALGLELRHDTPSAAP